MRNALVSLILLVATAFSVAAEPVTSDTCLLAFASNLARGEGNFYLYEEFSKQRLVVREGDVLEYDVYIDKSSPVACGGIDIEFDGKPALREIDGGQVKDQNGLRAHGDAVLEAGKWHSRRIALDKASGWTATTWLAVFEGDKYGSYCQFVDNVVVRHRDGSETVIYRDGPAPACHTHRRESYSALAAVEPVERRLVTDSGDLSALVEAAAKRQRTKETLEQLRNELSLAEELVRRCAGEGAAALKEIEATRARVEQASRQSELADSELKALEADVGGKLQGCVAPLSHRYTGHLVGHAHIDAQWLWEWPETVQEFKKTFGQAVRFMQEFPGFTFTQSSTMFYQATEQHWPDLFRQIQDYVQEGRWELVGGRITEADTNILSAESHARQFLYGQRYFRERFRGKQAVVAWEPDTFGHNHQMPQIVKLGGCDYYYFWRAGKEIPLFWWEGLDGTRVLAFQEVNSTYNSDLTEKQFHEMLDLDKRCGVRDMLWVYGVGNHGGGPTREYLQVATDWMSRTHLPKVKFSTATDFFHTVEHNYDLTTLPVVRSELNYVFEGCYTTHGDVKRWNNDAQAAAESAEAVAAIAAGLGYKYPRAEIRRIWEDICWNQHHDTIDGSAIHAAYKKSRVMYEDAIASSSRIAHEALGWIADNVSASRGALVVFNPVGVARDALVEFELSAGVAEGSLWAVAAKERSAVQRQSGDGRKAVFAARAIPPYGYRCYQIQSGGAESPKPEVHVSPDGTVLENAKLRLTLDSRTGWIRSLVSKPLGREFVAQGGSANRLEVHWEKPNGMPAWDIGTIDHVDVLTGPVTMRVVESGPARAAVTCERKFRDSTIVQKISLSAEGDMAECELAVDWKETGNPTLWPMLRLASDSSVTSAVANFDIPFGNVSRPVDGHEVPALKWVDLSGADFGLALLNDCKHGHSVKDSTIRLTVVRTPTSPDSNSDNYPQTVRYAFYPHAGDWQEAQVVGRSFAWVHPVVSAWKVGQGKAPLLPAEQSFVEMADRRAIVTCVKRAEDDEDLVVRYYECEGRAGESAVRLAWPVRAMSSTNFLEDRTPVTPIAESKELRVPLRGYEIKTLKLGVAR